MKNIKIVFFYPPPLKGRNTSESLSLLNDKRLRCNKNIKINRLFVIVVKAFCANKQNLFYSILYVFKSTIYFI